MGAMGARRPSVTFSSNKRKDGMIGKMPVPTRKTSSMIMEPVMIWMMVRTLMRPRFGFGVGSRVGAWVGF